MVMQHYAMQLYPTRKNLLVAMQNVTESPLRIHLAMSKYV